MTTSAASAVRLERSNLDQLEEMIGTYGPLVRQEAEVQRITSGPVRSSAVASESPFIDESHPAQGCLRPSVQVVDPPGDTFEPENLEAV